MASAVLADAARFLAPVRDPRKLAAAHSTSLVRRLAPPPPSAATDADNVARRTAIHRALALLVQLHRELWVAGTDPGAPLALENPTDRRTVFSLLDLLVLEGIYPSLSKGVGIPIERRARSFLLPSQLAPGKGEDARKDRDLLKAVVSGVLGVLGIGKNRVVAQQDAQPTPSSSPSVERMIRERCLVDLVAGCAELAFNPEAPAAEVEAYTPLFNRLLEMTPLDALLPVLLSLLHPLCPAYFRKRLAKQLALLPINRPHGVRSILMLFLSASSGGTETSVSSQQLSLEALSKASRLVSSVPTSLDAAEYFSKVCPQILECMRSGDPGLERAAAFAIAELLGKKGVAEAVIDREIVQKITAVWNPCLRSPLPNPSSNLESALREDVSSVLLAFEDTPNPSPTLFSLVTEIPKQTSADSLDRTLVSEARLATALHDLELLLSSHPGLLTPERFVKPILASLWGLLSFSKVTKRSDWYARVSAIFKSYIAVSLDTNILSTLLTGISCTSDSRWEFAPGSTGGVEIRQSSAKGLDMDSLDAQVSEFVDIIGNAAKETVLNQFFLDILRTWLSRADEEDPLRMLVITKVLQEMLGRHSDTLVKKPTETLQIVHSVLDEYMVYCKSREETTMPAAPEAPRLAMLRNIAPAATEETAEDASERAETAEMALSLVSVILSSSETLFVAPDYVLLSALAPVISYLSSSPIISSDLKNIAINLLSLFSLHTPQQHKDKQLPLAEQQKEIYSTALSHIRDPLVPIRAHGLYLLQRLIEERAAPVDVTATTRLLVNMLKDADSYVYLSVIKCLTALTDKHAKTAVFMLLAAYVDDPAELDLDQRLRLGEALLGTVQRLGEILTGELAEEIGACMLVLVSRRRTRFEDSGAKLATNKPREEDKQGEVYSDDDMDDEGLLLTESQKAARNVHARIVASWSGAATRTEDLRLRTSSLSILGMAIENNAVGFGMRIVRDAVDVSLSILALEADVGAAILRRAAVLCLGALVKAALDRRSDSTAYTILAERANDIRRSLAYTRVADGDGLVREQASVVGENVEACLERRALGIGIME